MFLQFFSTNAVKTRDSSHVSLLYFYQVFIISTGTFEGKGRYGLNLEEQTNGGEI